MSTGRADLHCHTTMSDGTFTPTELVEEAARRGLAAIAVTDHDSVDGIEEALQAAKGTEVYVVPGVEISTDVSDGEVHILGFCINYKNEGLLGLLESQRESRMRRVEQMLKKLAALGISLNKEDVLEHAGEGAVGRPHIAAAMVRAGYVLTWDEAFAHYIGFHAPAYVSRSKLTPFEAVEAILTAQGVPVLAHPGLADKDEMIPGLVECGLGGIEVFYPHHTQAQQKRYESVADEYGLIATGGSDCHGPLSQSGVVLGSATTDYGVVLSLHRRALATGGRE
ncbi:MAG: PHP domain-containing protein [Firmicutes bacterium]|nr:PHP domain-containing protein [Bacillota bacterium]MDD4337369.1 PHP domain-containing protein [Bacillota bacterium]MDD4791670.1 PHP domain-containing protein [Bacillota bacterium]